MYRILDMIGEDLGHRNNTGMPLTEMQNLCIALDILAGGHFQRVGGRIGNVQQSVARRCLIKVVDALLNVKGEWIHLPNLETMRESARYILQTFGLKM